MNAQYVASMLRDAEAEGAGAVELLSIYERDGDPVTLQSAITLAEVAASSYHEAQRARGECPMCGGIFTDPWGGVHYNSSLGCCIEPPEPDYESALASSPAVLNDPTHPRNVEMRKLKGW